MGFFANVVFQYGHQDQFINTPIIDKISVTPMHWAHHHECGIHLSNDLKYKTSITNQTRVEGIIWPLYAIYLNVIVHQKRFNTINIWIKFLDSIDWSQFETIWTALLRCAFVQILISFFRVATTISGKLCNRCPVLRSKPKPIFFLSYSDTN